MHVGDEMTAERQMVGPTAQGVDDLIARTEATGPEDEVHRR